MPIHSRFTKFCRVTLLGKVLLFSLMTGWALGEEVVEEIERKKKPQVEAPHIPEPLLFDLMRPLHAKKGELEVNTLAVFPRNGKAHWAPEVEYAVADGVAIEFEFPFVNSHFESTKLGFQFRLGHNEKSVHGIQVLGEFAASGPSQTSVSALYLYGHRFDETWSLMSMTGLQTVYGNQDREWRGLQNLSIFRNESEALTTGIELNWSFTSRDLLEELAITPQLHYSFDKDWMVQTGVGMRKSDGNRWNPEYSLRLIRQL